jgi:hypothetical protein
MRHAAFLDLQVHFRYRILAVARAEFGTTIGAARYLGSQSKEHTYDGAA